MSVDNELAGMTVLVIDDEELVVNTASAVLRSRGLRALAAKSGAAGVEFLRQRREEIGLVVLDFSMPGMDGAETLRELRRIDPEVRVVLSSGLVGEQLASHFEGRGLTVYLQKPYRAADLIPEVRRCLGARSGLPSS